MHVLVVAGFLGAGKTTFIQELSRRSGERFVVYENECGQADIDAQILRDDDDLTVWESLDNCICCTGKQDFASSVLTIANTIDPDVLVVEPTGIARLSSVLGNIESVRYERIDVLPSIAIVGADTWARQHDQFPSIYVDQVAHADTVIISKADRAGVGEVAAAAAWVRERNPHARIIDTPYRRLPDAWFMQLLHGEQDTATSRDTRHAAERAAAAAAGTPCAEPASSAATRVSTSTTAGAAPTADAEIGTIAIDDPFLQTPAHLFWLLDALCAGVFGHVVRAKGTIAYAGSTDEWLRFDVVDRSWAVTGAPAAANEHPQAVFIGTELKRTWLLVAFSPAHADAGHAAAGARLRSALASAHTPRATR